eukprot:235356-Amphidinium_carterae.1
MDKKRVDTATLVLATTSVEEELAQYFQELLHRFGQPLCHPRSAGPGVEKQEIQKVTPPPPPRPQQRTMTYGLTQACWL